LGRECRSIAHPAAGAGQGFVSFPLISWRAVWRGWPVIRRHTPRRLENCSQFLHVSLQAVAVPGISFRSQIREVTMSIFSYRKHLRFLTHAQRRRWWDQKKRLTPRVRISGAYVPPSVSREFAYVKVG
jgi:hypothetical protein